MYFEKFSNKQFFNFVTNLSEEIKLTALEVMKAECG